MCTKIFNEYSRHYSTIPSGSQTVLKTLTFLALYQIYGSVTHISPQVGESDKFLLVESGIPNTAQGIRNPTNDWNPETKFHRKRLESSTWNQESTAWNAESKTVLDSLMHGATVQQTWLVQCVVESRTDLCCNSPSPPSLLPMKKNWFKKQNIKAISFHFKKFLERFSLLCLRCEEKANYVMPCLHLCSWYIIYRFSQG